ncbi:MAG: efflux transporter outer membrane subunit [Deltaproteobacteria bacterium]|nr:efflux transporter outer membrane subunit [Deltaproteobacteria bacterium]MBW2070290.1 efflux transporter outer membrane subunit [Deltaproteobacteria bacterium]
MKTINFIGKGRAQNRWCCLRAILLGTLMVVTLPGCAAVGPDYVPVEPEAPAKWHAELQGGLTAEQLNPQTLAHWWTTLHDPQLSSLEKRAVEGNLDLKEARARIREARALRGISKANLFPTVDAVGSITDHRNSENSGPGTGQRRSESNGTGTDRAGSKSAPGLENKLYSAGFDASWELDVFGGVRRSVEAAEANLQAAQEDLHDVLVSLLAEVALNYVEVRAFQARLAVTEANTKTQQESYDLNKSRYQAGLIDELAVQESLRILEASRSQIPALETGLEAAKNRLAVLLGEQPGTLHRELAAKRPIPVLPPTVVVGIPADTLRHRPDIRRAERLVAARTAEIGVATADLYPRFRLFGTIGLESISSDDFFEYGSRTWTFGPAVSWNVFDAGAIRQNIKVHTARQEQALIQYEATVLRAQEEIENVLVAYAKEQHRRESLVRAATAAKRAALLAQDQYQAGLVDFNNVLDAQRSLLILQDQLAQSDAAVTANLVRLYKALGGGWKSLKPSADKSTEFVKDSMAP